MELVKGRTLEAGDLVHIYKNLNRDCFSIKNKKTGLVVAYVQSATLKDAKFHVSKSGRQRVLDKQVRSVHAWVEGIFIAGDHPKPVRVSKVIYYNPYRTETFIFEESGQAVLAASYAHCENNRVYC
ncbi:hypothetical protein [Paenibacillus sp. Y412MC10]|uniref:hypothetical protein n=1 Tax=Geobacillus sp. (strain Y412MC10) TaxID=481743 RepID=UPI0011AB743C|nr:hypothetical protein [Paenibacillus sp. Y412MC10]